MRIVAIAGILTVLVFVSLGVYHVISPIEPNRCKMTYSQPSYSKFEVTSSSEYETYRYRNGGHRPQSKKTKVPVVFVPGHKGAFTQVRSLGSVADKLQTENLELEYYTIDFKDSISGVVGFQTIEQAAYLNEVLNTISFNYGKSTPILIVGHSMGGFVARAAYTMRNFNTTNVETIVTLSTPHVQAPIGIDRVLNRLYTRVNTIWNKAVTANNTSHQSEKLKAMRKVSIVSIAGGSRDPLVPTSLTDVVRSELSSPELGVSIMSSRVELSQVHRQDPTVRKASQDHLSILWCNQLLHPITEYLYQVAKNPKRKIHHLKALLPKSSTISREVNEVLGNEARRRERALMRKRGIREAISFASAQTLRNHVNLGIVTWFALCMFHLASILYFDRGSGRTIVDVANRVIPTFSLNLKSLGVIVLIIGLGIGWTYHNLADESFRGYVKVRGVFDSLICVVVVHVMMILLLYTWSGLASLKRICLGRGIYLTNAFGWICLILSILCAFICHFDMSHMSFRSFTLSRELACFVLSSLILQIVTIFATVMFVSSREGTSNNISYLVLLILCSAPMLLLSLGTAIHAFDVAFERRLHIVSDSNWDFFYTAVLHFVPTLNMFLEMRKQPQKKKKNENVKKQNTQAIVPSRSIFCEKCLCPTAQFERIQVKSRQKEIVFDDGEVVVIGSTYRIVYCECPKYFRDRSLWCAWCKHRDAVMGRNKSSSSFYSSFPRTEQGRVQTFMSIISICASLYVIFYAREHLDLCRDAVFLFASVSAILKVYPKLASYIL